MFGNREFAELVVWRVPEPVPASRHSFKDCLVHVVDGTRVLGFDNERGKGDHRHHGDRESHYEFQEIDQLLADFIVAVEDCRAAHGGV